MGRDKQKSQMKEKHGCFKWVNCNVMHWSPNWSATFERLPSSCVKNAVIGQSCNSCYRRFVTAPLNVVCFSSDNAQLLLLGTTLFVNIMNIIIIIIIITILIIIVEWHRPMFVSLVITAHSVISLALLFLRICVTLTKLEIAWIKYTHLIWYKIYITTIFVSCSFLITNNHKICCQFFSVV